MSELKLMKERLKKLQGSIQAQEHTLQALTVGLFAGSESEIISNLKSYHRQLHAKATEEYNLVAKNLETEMDKKEMTDGPSDETKKTAEG